MNATTLTLEEQYLALVFPENLPGVRRIWESQEKMSKDVPAEPAGILKSIQSWPGRNVYVQMATRIVGLPSSKRGEKGDCVAVAGAWADVDGKDFFTQEELEPFYQEAYEEELFSLRLRDMDNRKKTRRRTDPEKLERRA